VKDQRDDEFTAFVVEHGATPGAVAALAADAHRRRPATSTT
jgi:hypothetical protein